MAKLTNSRVVRPASRTSVAFTAPLRATGKALAVFSGHCHAYEHFVVDGLHHVVSGGGGGPLQPLWTGKRRRFPDLFAWPGRHRFLHFCALHIGDHAVRVDVVRFQRCDATSSAGGASGGGGPLWTPVRADGFTLPLVPP